MSAPAQVALTPEAYGERQDTPAPSSEGVMDNLSAAAQKDVASARQCLKDGFDAALSQLEMQYQMEKARLSTNFAELDGRLRDVEETIASYKVNAIKAMDNFLTQCKSASITAVELVPLLVEPERPIEPPTPKFLANEPQPPRRQPMLRAIAPIVIFAIAVVAMISVGVAAL